MRALARMAAFVLVVVALAGCGQSKEDSDSDQLYDATERAGWDVKIDLMTERISRHVKSDPSMKDTDGDGLLDNHEFQLPGLDPQVDDTDGDGLTDCQEAYHTNVTQCEDATYQGPWDGGYGTDPARADSDPGYSRYVNEQGFTDHTDSLPNGLAESGDGISDGEEIAGYTITLGGRTRQITTDPRNGDHDDDGLEDGEERFLFGSDPTVPDSDGDGCTDGLDLVPEREELFSIGLGVFTLKRSGNANLRVYSIVANYEEFTPTGAPMQVRSGEPTDLAPLMGPPGRSDDCSYAPYDPWVLVEVHALDVLSGESATSLDITSGTDAPVAPGHAAQFYWDVRGDQLSWDARGEDPWPLAAGVLLEGADAKVLVMPAVSDS